MHNSLSGLGGGPALPQFQAGDFPEGFGQSSACHLNYHQRAGTVPNGFHISTSDPTCRLAHHRSAQPRGFWVAEDL
jgi:hypothetical protein